MPFNLETVNIIILRKYLYEIKSNKDDIADFSEKVKSLISYLEYGYKNSHIVKLFETISDSGTYPAFEIEKYTNLSMTFHSSKGLEFDRVLLFASDYPLNDDTSKYNHYVASTRAKNNLLLL